MEIFRTYTASGEPSLKKILDGKIQKGSARISWSCKDGSGQMMIEVRG